MNTNTTTKVIILLITLTAFLQEACGEYQVIVSEGISWTDAREQAKAIGSGWDLASITSAAEQAVVIALMPQDAHQRDHYWLGGTDTLVEGDWEWISGEPWIDGVSFEHWYPGEPNDGLGGEDHLTMDFRDGSWGGWNDLGQNNSRYVRGFIAEKIPEPNSLILVVGSVLSGLGLLNRKRRFLEIVDYDQRVKKQKGYRA